MEKYIAAVTVAILHFSSFAYSQGTLSNQNEHVSQSMSERSKQVTRESIENERMHLAQQTQTRPIVEALQAVNETRRAVRYIDNNQIGQARTALETALGKIDIITSNYPNLDLIPEAVDIRMIDNNANDATIKHITDSAKHLVNEGDFQAARELLSQLASEIDITTVNLPIFTYPESIRNAAQMLNQNKLKEAKAQLLTALQSLVVIQSNIPLPLLRAQALVDEANRLSEEPQKASKSEIDQFLNDADQQLALAEKLGYTINKEELSNLRSSIKNLKEMLHSDQDTKTLFSKLKRSLSHLKEQFSQHKGKPKAESTPKTEEINE